MIRLRAEVLAHTDLPAFLKAVKIHLMDAKTRAIFRKIMREIGRKGGEIAQAQPGGHDARGADRAGEESVRGGRRGRLRG